ncbi:MAG: hypothetical protein GY943_11640, partial [Chloroflexi bacterium]|nr:hypothetical protein [Chloroflexota bacterium]
TLAAGDVQVSTDGGALGNLGTLPVVTPAGSKMVKVTLSAAEMDGDNATVVFSDAAGDQWCDLVVNLHTAAKQFDELNATTPPTALAIRTEMDTNSTKLANLDATISSRLAAAGYTAPDNASVANILLDTDFLQLLFAGLTEDSGGNRFTAKALEQAPSGGGSLTAAQVWQHILEDAYTAEEMVRIILASTALKSNGGGTGTLAFRNIADTKNRLVVTVNDGGNRTAVSTLDGS